MDKSVHNLIHNHHLGLCITWGQGCAYVVRKLWISLWKSCGLRVDMLWKSWGYLGWDGSPPPTTLFFFENWRTK